MIELCITTILALYSLLAISPTLQQAGLDYKYKAKILVFACFFKPLLVWNPLNWSGISLLFYIIELFLHNNHVNGPLMLFDLILGIAVFYLYHALVDGIPLIYLLLTLLLEEPHCAAYCRDLISKLNEFGVKLGHFLCSLNRPLFHQEPVDLPPPNKDSNFFLAV